MEIFWLGHGCFRIRGREATVVTDPCPPATGYKIGRLAADLVTISRADPESTYRQAITGEPKFITAPGEYEISGVLVHAIRTGQGRDTNGRNIAFLMNIDDIRVCYLGAVRRPPGGDEVEVLGGPDVLILPVGGGNALDAGAAAETVSVLEPKVVVPMRFKTEAATAAVEGVDKFLREMGAEGKTAEPRLSVTKSNLPHATTVVLLEYRG